MKAEDFEETWSAYMEAYEACRPQDFLAEMQEELNRRIASAGNDQGGL